MKTMRLLLFMGVLAWAVSCGAQSAEVHDAARTGDVARLNELIGATPELVNAKGEDDDTPLHTAAMAGKMNAVLYLIGKGAAIDARNTINQSPLLYAAYGGSAAIVDTLIAHGAPFDYQDTRGFAPIHFAARQGGTGVVALLVSKGATFDGRGYQGKTPLDFAAMNGHAEIVKLLAARGAALDTKDDAGLTPMTSALQGGHAQAAEALLDAGAPIEGDEAALAHYLHLAAGAGSQRIVDALVERGARLDDTDETGKTLLHDAAIGNLAGLAATMIARMKDINVADKGGRTALHCAVSKAHHEIIELLLGRGADPNCADAEGRTPLHVAEDAGRGDIAKLLRDKGARDAKRYVHRLARVPSTTPQKGNDAPLEITYIGNEGFMISRGDKKVIIDAIQTNPWTYMPTGERIFSMMLEDRPPFDGIDVCIASHAHADHMNPTMTVQLLERNPRIVFMSSPIARDSLRIVAKDEFGNIAKRVVSVDPDWKQVIKLSQNDIDVEFFGVNHAGIGQDPYKTLATVIDFDGIRVAHLADEVAASNLENYQAINLASAGIDIVFVDRGFFDSIGQQILKDYVKPEYLILMHARPNELDAAAKDLLPLYPNLLLFREQLEKMLFDRPSGEHDPGGAPRNR
jgi:ankyrin repeat protein